MIVAVVLVVHELTKAEMIGSLEDVCFYSVRSLCFKTRTLFSLPDTPADFGGRRRDAASSRVGQAMITSSRASTIDFEAAAPLPSSSSS